MMHPSLISQSLLKLGILISLLFWPLDSGRSCATCCMLNAFLWIIISFVAWFTTLQTKIVYVSALFFIFCEWFESCFVNLHGVVIGYKHHMFGLQHGQRELLQYWCWFSMLLLLMFKKLIIVMHSLCNCLTQGHGIKHGQKKVLLISMDSKLKLVHEHDLIPWNVTC
jgi:hypothetical protein